MKNKIMQSIAITTDIRHADPCPKHNAKSKVKKAKNEVTHANFLQQGSQASAPEV